MSFSARGSEFQDFPEKLRIFFHLIGVVLLQDMRTRYGGRSVLGYIFSTMIPLAHMSVITGLYYIRMAISPVGDNPGLFVATGIVPYILCLYPAREMPRTLIENRQLLAIPILQPIHLMLSRAVLEMLSAMIALAIFALGLYLLGIDLMPIDPHEAARAVAAAVFLGIGFGFFNTFMAGLLGFFAVMAFILVAIGLYLSAGVFVPVGSMPEELKEFAAYNPIFQLVEWQRSAYYTSYDIDSIDKTLVLGLAGASLLLGLVGERFIRGKLLT